jgi:hypothetical protein
MKIKLLLTILIFLIFYTDNYGQLNINTFKIVITESYMFQERVYRITPDSLTIIQTESNGSTNSYSTALSEKYKKKIVDRLSRLDLESLEDQYINHNAPDDSGDFIFNFIFNDITKEIFIYQVKLDGIYDLVKVINAIMIDKYQIGYNKEYFK